MPINFWFIADRKKILLAISDNIDFYLDAAYSLWIMNVTNKSEYFMENFAVNRTELIGCACSFDFLAKQTNQIDISLYLCWRKAKWEIAYFPTDTHLVPIFRIVKS